MIRLTGFCSILVGFWLSSCWLMPKNFNGHPLNCTNNGDDKLYDRKMVLQEFANVLNRIIKPGAFNVSEKSTGKGFVVFDLVDTTNFEGANDECVLFLDKHIYHFTSIIFEESFSNIAYLENGKITIFEAINCLKMGDNLQDVLNYITPKIAGNDERNKILYRIKNFRKYGYYVAYDNYSKIDCECEPCE